MNARKNNATLGFNRFVTTPWRKTRVNGAGVYGVMAYNVEQRRREIGLRLALGASPDGVIRLVLQNAAVLAGLGTVIGVVAAIATGRALRGMLFGVSSSDPVILTMVSLLLVVVSILASAIPAWKAARIDPLTALSGG